MSKLKNMRLVEIPKFRALSSGILPLEDIFFAENSFSAWLDAHRDLIKEHIFEPQDFLWHENDDINRSTWIVAIKDGVTENDTAPYSIMEFPGGMVCLCAGGEKITLEVKVWNMHILKKKF